MRIRALKDGNTRTLIKFAFLPVDIGEELLFLERYKEYQVYHKSSIKYAGYWSTIKREPLE